MLDDCFEIGLTDDTQGFFIIFGKETKQFVLVLFVEVPKMGQVVLELLLGKQLRLSGCRRLLGRKRLIIIENLILFKGGLRRWNRFLRFFALLLPNWFNWRLWGRNFRVLL